MKKIILFRFLKSLLISLSRNSICKFANIQFCKYAKLYLYKPQQNNRDYCYLCKKIETDDEDGIRKH